jgi:endonuclease/exonuclease/phosphatase family metal-dependent hydrolase
VLDELSKNNIDVCCVQETELDPDINPDIISSSEFVFEVEKSTVKKRVGIFINKRLSYERRLDLEEVNRHIIIIDLNLGSKYRVISIYRSFRPSDMLSPLEFFIQQIALIEKNLTTKTIVLGDFNLDVNKQFMQDYNNKIIYNELTNLLARKTLFQLVDFPTWSRIINNIKKESTLDHIYVTDSTFVKRCFYLDPLFGDHLTVIIELDSSPTPKGKVIGRNWRNYSPVKLIDCLSSVDLNFKNDCVQEYWNSLENVLINVVDTLAPLTPFDMNPLAKSHLPMAIKNKLNKRKRLLKKTKTQTCTNLRNEIKALNKDIKSFIYNKIRQTIRNKINSNNKYNLWKGVNLAMNKSSNQIPTHMKCDNVDVDVDNVANAFADHFYEKIETIKLNLNIRNDVYNGKNKLLVVDRFFMKESDINECLRSLSQKTCEGFDRIPLKFYMMRARSS